MWVAQDSTGTHQANTVVREVGFFPTGGNVVILSYIEVQQLFDESDADHAQANDKYASALTI